MSATTNEANGILSFGANWNQSSHTANKSVTDKYNTTIRNARAIQSVHKTVGNVEEGVGGAQAGFSALKQGGNARNFDSAVAGFGTGKGVSGYLHPYTQTQMLKGRVKYAQTRIAQATGEDIKTPQTAAEMGMEQRLPESAVSGPRAYGGGLAQKNLQLGDVTSTSGVGADMSKAQGSLAQLRKGSGATADITGTAMKSDEAMVKAGGGMYLKGAGDVADLGATGGLIKKTIGKFADVAPKQLGAIAETTGKGFGIFGAAKAIYDRTNGDYSKDTTLQKAGNTGDMIAGGLDALSVAIPVLAPFAGAASGISAALDIAGSSQAEKKGEATAKSTELAAQAPSMKLGSITSQGKVGSTQVSAY
jgi:hypothetical protein